jgi:hypothetical protein
VATLVPSDQAGNFSAAAVTTISVTMNNPVPPGSAIIALVTNSGTGTTTTGVSGGSGATWTQRLSVNSTGTIGAEIWESLHQAFQASAPTIVFTFPSQSFYTATVFVVPMIASYDTGSATGTGTSTTELTGSITPGTPGEFLVAIAANGAGLAPSSGPTNGFTASTQTPNGDTSAYLLDTAAASISTSWTLGSSHTWVALIAAYKTTPLAEPYRFNMSQAVHRAAHF